MGCRGWVFKSPRLHHYFIWGKKSLDSNKTNKNDAKNRIMQRKKLKNYKYKKLNAEDVFTLEDYLTQEEIEKLMELL